MRDLTQHDGLCRTCGRPLGGDEHEVDGVPGVFHLECLPGQVRAQSEPVAVPAKELKERIAKLLWERFAPAYCVEWEGETHKSEYRSVAGDVIAMLAAAPVASHETSPVINKPTCVSSVTDNAPPAASEPVPAAGPDADLVQRCREVIEWQSTGILHGGEGGSLRALAETYGDEHYGLSRAEAKTLREAAEFVVSAATTPPAESGEVERKGGLEEVGATARGYTIYREQNGVGGHRYWSDEIGGGVVAWDTCLVAPETLQTCLRIEMGEALYSHNPTPPPEPAKAEVVDQARDIIARGCGCDRDCEKHGERCGCRSDAMKVLALATKQEAALQFLAGEGQRCDAALNHKDQA